MADYKRCALKGRKGEKEKEEKIKGKRRKKWVTKSFVFLGVVSSQWYNSYMVFRVYPSLRAVSISGVHHILIISLASSEQEHGS